MSLPDDNTLEELDQLVQARLRERAPTRLRVFGAVVWPAFIAACLVEFVVFAAFNPEDFDGLGTWQRETILSFAFILFWGACMIASLVTWLLSRESR